MQCRNGHPIARNSKERSPCIGVTTSIGGRGFWHRLENGVTVFILPGKNSTPIFWLKPTYDMEAQNKPNAIPAREGSIGSKPSGVGSKWNGRVQHE
jgi:hypothetical protein